MLYVVPEQSANGGIGVTTTETRRLCEACEEYTLHEVERNRETGWHRQRCEQCDHVKTLSHHSMEAGA